MREILNYSFNAAMLLSLSGAIVSLAALIVCAVGRKLSPALRYYIWLVPLIAFFIAAPKIDFVRRTEIVPSVEMDTAVEAQKNTGENMAIEPAASKVETQDAGAAAPVRRPIDMRGLMALYFITAAALLVRIPISRLRFSRKMKRLSAMDSELSQIAGVRVRRFSGTGTPFVAGVFSPVIYLPMNSAADEDLMLRHELVHVRRHDLLFKLAADIAGALHFFNPMVYVLKNRIGHYCELSCDEAVTYGMNADERGDYAKMILAFASSSTAPSFTAALTEKAAGVRERLLAVTKPRRRSLCATVVSVFLAVTLSLGGVVIAAEINGLNKASVPQFSYVAKIVNNSYESGDLNGFIAEIAPTAQAYYSNVFGRVRFHAAFMAFNKELFTRYSSYAGSIMSFDYQMLPADYFETKKRMLEEFEAEKAKEENYDQAVEIELLNVTRSYGGTFFEGDFLLRINGEEQTVKGRLSNMPPYMDYCLYAPTLELNIDGKILEFFLDFDSGFDAEAVNRRLIEKRYYLEQNFFSDGSGSTKRIVCAHDDENIMGEITLDYNPELRLIDGNFAYLGRDGGVCRLRPVTVDEVDGSEVSGKMYIVGSINGFYGIGDVLDYTISGIDGKPGDKLTMKAEGYELTCTIEEYKAPPMNYKGNKSVGDFNFGSEKVFVGTPLEQDEFNKLHPDDGATYNRIIIGEDGSVICIVPVDCQSGNGTRLNIPDYTEAATIFESDCWVDIINNAAYGDVNSTWLLVDGLSGEPAAVVKPDNQYLIKED